MRKINFFNIVSSHGSMAVKAMKLMDYWFGTLVAFFLPSQKITRFDFKKIKSILIVRPGGIGDAVFLLPILKILKAQGYGLTILCESRNKEVFISQGYDVYLYHHFQDFKKVLSHSYDAVIDTEQWHYLSGIMGYFIKSQVKIGFATRPLRKKLFNLPLEYDQGAHELDNFLKLFENLYSLRNMKVSINGSFDVPQELQDWASSEIPKKSIAVFLGGSIILRRLSIEQLMSAVTQVLKEDEHVILLGGLDVDSTARQIVRQINDPRILNFVGTVSLIQSAALIQRSQRFVGPDSGLMHLACALNVPVIAIFGPGNIKKWAPRSESRFRIVSKYLPCSPCTNFGYTIPTCKGSYGCLKNLTIN